MVKIFKIGFFLLFAFLFVYREALNPMEVFFLLTLMTLELIYEKYYRDYFLWIIKFFILTYISIRQPLFVFLFSIWSLDGILKKRWIASLSPILIGVLVLAREDLIYYIFIFFLSYLLAYVLLTLNEKEEGLKKAFDKERKIRYELESQKTELLSSMKKIQELSEVTERNRISREIHDHVGHSIAGILLQLEVAEKLFERDPSLAKESLEKSRLKLSDTLVVLRNTIHNIKPKEKTGINYLKEIVDDFQYGQVEFTYWGDFSKLPSHHLDILASNLKEALTNIQKYSKAKNIKIEASVNPKFVRLYIKDDGIGCREVSFNKGMGLSGMKERVEGLGGHISISGKDGFTIVSIIPLEGYIS